MHRARCPAWASILERAILLIKTSVGGFQLALASNAVRPLRQHNWRMLFMLQPSARTLDLQMADVKRGGDIACESLVTIESDRTKDPMMVARRLACSDDCRSIGYTFHDAS